MGAGILPVAFNGVSVLFLLGREQYNRQWADFGGTSNYSNEPIYNTAIREGYEELSGLLGSEYELRHKVKNNLICTQNDNRYTSFIFETAYDRNLPLYFNRNFCFTQATSPRLINNNHNGLYEKSEIRWFTASEIRSLNLRPFYKNIIFPILENEKKIENRMFHRRNDKYSKPYKYANEIRSYSARTKVNQAY